MAEIKDTIEFNGVTYRLTGSKKYYLSQSNSNAGRIGAKSLHVAIWEFYNKKKVPDGYCIHHKDGNTFNNDISNLECISTHEHYSMHSKKNFESEEYRQKNKEQLAKAQERAKEWHKSAEGKEWHLKHSREMDHSKRFECECVFCHTKFMSAQRTSIFCSDSCGAKYRRRLMNYEGVCEYCGKTFHYGKAVSSQPDKRFCSGTCARRFYWQNKK